MNTIQSIIDIVDRRTPNDYSNEDKVRWLKECDTKIYRNLIMRCENTDNIPAPDYEDTDKELLVDSAYAEDVYVNWLQFKIAKENNESERYNTAITLYNDAVREYSAWYVETHMPLQKKNYVRF